MQIRIVQVPGDDTHGESKMTERVDADLPISEVTSQKQYRSSGAQCSDTVFPALKLQHVGTIRQAEAARQLDHLEHHAKQMPPHAVNDPVGLLIRECRVCSHVNTSGRAASVRTSRPTSSL